MITAEEARSLVEESGRYTEIFKDEAEGLIENRAAEGFTYTTLRKKEHYPFVSEKDVLSYISNLKDRGFYVHSTPAAIYISWEDHEEG